MREKKRKGKKREKKKKGEVGWRERKRKFLPLVAGKDGQLVRWEGEKDCGGVGEKKRKGKKGEKRGKFFFS